jgi:methyl-accepting chemotaxis protein
VVTASDGDLAGARNSSVSRQRPPRCSSSIGEIGRQVAQSSSMAGKAVEDAHRTDAIVKTLATSAQRIGDVVGLISNIAGQTNLLQAA